MVAFSLVSFLFLAKLVLVSAIQANAPPVVPGAYIVELADEHDASAFYNALGASNYEVEPRLDLSYTLFKGVSFQFKNASDHEAAAEEVAKMTTVKQIWPVRVYSVPKDKVIWKGTDSTASMANSLLKRQSSDADTFSPHIMTQVDKLRADDIIGTGVKVGIIDTGVDYTHPALGGCFGAGCLVSYGTDLVGDNYDGYNTPVPDPDPYDGCEGHGTHVAGIIAAQENSFGFTGAAPGVTLGMYRVFGCGGSAGNDVLIDAYLRAYQDGSNIITASIGGSSGWSEDPWAVAVQRIVEAGVPCTVSAGNDGAEGLFYASTAANGKKVTAVASVDNILAPTILLNASYSVNNGSSEAFGWAQGDPSTWGNISLPLWAVSYNTSDPANGCTPYPDSTPDLSGYIVLIRRGTCTFVEKATYAAQKGAHYVMFYNNAAGAVSVSTVVDGIKGAGMVTADQGAEWISLLSSGSTVTLNIIDPASATQYAVNFPNPNTGGFLSTYTSWGPTYEIDIKPQVASPGGIILSTYPQTLGSYAVLSGTSMACPLTAAVIALISNVRGTFDPATIENLLSATANPNVFQDGKTAYGYLAPVAQQGAGLIQAYDAAHATTLLSVSSISFNDTEHLPRSKNFSIKNTGSQSVTYQLANVGAATGYTLAAGSIYPDIFPNELLATYADISFSTTKVTVPAGGQVSITVSPKPPTGLDASRLPVWSGYITLNATNGESLSLPYLGVAGSMHNATVFDTTYLTESTDPNYNPVAANTTFVIPKSNGTTNATYPAVVVSLALGSRIVRVDVVPSSPQSNATIILGAKSLGNIYGYPFTYNPRGAWVSTWDGQLEDGTYAPAGSYTLLVRALRIFGDVRNPRDYQGLATVPFSISYS